LATAAGMASDAWAALLEAGATAVVAVDTRLAAGAPAGGVTAAAVLETDVRRPPAPDDAAAGDANAADGTARTNTLVTPITARRALTPGLAYGRMDTSSN
jgi:hypothetical protein